MQYIKEILGSVKDLKDRRTLFTLVIATTDVSLIPGITVAGATPELTHFTPAADAEFLILGKCRSINTIPITPDGIPTPAIITRASLELVKIPKLIINAGSRVIPRLPIIDIGGEPGGDIRKFSLRKEAAQKILENSIILGEELSKSFDLLIIGESIPAGTTTAMALLTGLGYDALDKVSSASPQNPKDLKRKVVLEAIKDLPEDTLGKVSKLADPMLLAAAGLTIGFKGDVVLAGGTQMTAASALIRELDKSALTKATIITTKWIVEDTSSDIVSLAKQVGVSLAASTLDFSRSKFEGLRAYEKGYVKEGVGAGGASGLALAHGYTPEDILNKVEEIYSQLMSNNK
ncbi:nicotinate mononucleotide-dependent phosphoribosyltransferase CobT [Stygiolobus caldivivus]|uniref:UPF0284 protein KN1_05630 n=1 Tax=Stygiolobus caldivivus TaxID=2824673 RepID=A0A8D5U4H6_9CREN|nr:TIGR00303 family protein [Stygiolobus caldivivus]BCU69266.1 TIGR00303 family protein [Stygiolobus caldivivus]